MSIDIKLDHQIHNRIIGQKGRNVRKIMEDFNVDIRFPRDPTDDTVTITGSEEAVDDCEEYLLVLEEEYVSWILFDGKFRFSMLCCYLMKRIIDTLD